MALSWTLVSGDIVVGDPLYVDYAKDASKRRIFSSAVVFKGQPGEWHAKAIMKDCKFDNRPDIRVTELLTWHSSAEPQAEEYKYTGRSFNVDSGQGGIFDLDKVPTELGEYKDPSSFYGQACQHTLSDAQVGVITINDEKVGVVSSSGFGDGQYSVYGVKKDSVYTALKFIYIIG